MITYFKAEIERLRSELSEMSEAEHTYSVPVFQEQKILNEDTDDDIPDLEVHPEQEMELLSFLKISDMIDEGLQYQNTSWNYIPKHFSKQLIILSFKGLTKLNYKCNIKHKIFSAY